ncbi:MAG: hypothetical protein J1F29_00775 [Lentimicrobiaceae bacterium]|nr:hypothetical protein [Lentimicrobiaceae bacterium]
MKKIFFILAVAIVAVACKKEEKEHDSSDILIYALCKMDISGKPQAKAFDVVGDSVSVHKLSRYMSFYTGNLVNYGWGDFIINTHQEILFTDYLTRYYQRDTINHTFSFTNDAVICWMEENVVDGQLRGGKDGTEYLGYVVCMEDFVFCAAYDACAENGVECEAGKEYFDPVTATQADWGEFIGYHYVSYDTLGYIPNSQMRANRAHLQGLIDERKYQEMLDFFKRGYCIYTCTGEEYRELVRLGLN